LAEFLLKKGYKVHGVKRRVSSFNTDRIEHLYQDPHIENRNLILHYGDMTGSMNLTKIIQEVHPDEIYNLAAMSHIHVSFEIPEDVANTDGIGSCLGCYLLGKKLLERISGIDLMEELINLSSDKGFKCFFFGATNTVVTTISKYL